LVLSTSFGQRGTEYLSRLIIAAKTASSLFESNGTGVAAPKLAWAEVAGAEVAGLLKNVKM